MAGYSEMRRCAKEAEHEDSETALKRFMEREGVDYGKEQLEGIDFNSQKVDILAHKRFRMINELEARFLFNLTKMPETKTLITSRYFPAALEQEDNLDTVDGSAKLTLKEVRGRQRQAGSDLAFMLFAQYTFYIRQNECLNESLS
ncbi:MAG: hypothetical protein H8D67_31450 [Deltaproteobacteria bacterium]|nr:hypothetical protein [Deltaproteobacteria bacterium]